MNFNASVKLHNKFEVYVKDIRSGKERLIGTAYNMVLSAMWTQIISDRRSPFDYICYGRGTGELSPDRTSLFSQIAQVSSTRVEEVYSSDSGYIKEKIELSPSTAVGETITEVGIRGYNRLVTHALLKDAEGNPISFVKTDTDVVTIYATLYCRLSVTSPLGFSQAQVSSGAAYRVLNSGYIESSVIVGRNPMPLDADSINAAGICDSYAASKSSSRIAYDVATATESYKVRFEIADANLFIKEIQVADTASIILPESSIIGKVLYENVPLGTGDNVKTKFLIPSPYIETPLVDVKVNSVVASHTLERKPRVALACGSNHGNGGSGFSSYPSVVYPTAWGNKWIGNGEYKVQYGRVHRGYLRQYGSFSPSVGSIPDKPSYSSRSSGQPIFLNTESICVLPVNVWIDYSTDQAKSILSRFADIAPSTGVMTLDDQYLIYVDNSAGYIRLAKRDGEGIYNRVGTSQAGASGKYTYQNNFITADGNHVVFSGYHGLVIVSIDIANESIIQEVYDSTSRVVVCQYNGKIYTFAAGNYNIYELVSGVFTLTYTGTYENTMSLYGGGLVGDGLCLISDSNIANAKFIKLLPDSVEYYAPQSPLSHSITSINNIITDGSPVFYCGIDRSARTFYVDDSEVFVVLATPPTDAEAVTSSYKTEGIHKTDQFVLDVTFSVSYAEGV
jgi:hypothetical protein